MRYQLIAVIVILSFIYPLSIVAQTRAMKPLFPFFATDTTNLGVSVLMRRSVAKPDTPQVGWTHSGPYADRLFLAEHTSATLLLAFAFNSPIERVCSQIPLPDTYYDVEVIAPKGSESMLLPLVQQTIQTGLAVSARWETKETDVAILELDSTKPLLLKPSNPSQLADIPAGYASKGEIRTDHGLVKMVGTNLSSEGIATDLQNSLGMIVLNQTRSKQSGDLEMQWKQNDWDSLQESLGKLGLRLTKARKLAQILVVRPAAKDSKGK